MNTMQANKVAEPQNGNHKSQNQSQQKLTQRSRTKSENPKQGVWKPRPHKKYANGQWNSIQNQEENKEIFPLDPTPIIVKVLEENTEKTYDLDSFLEEIYTGKRGAQTQDFDKEEYFGPTEYKLKLLNPPEQRLQHLVTQMNFRLNEGGGEAQYLIGLEDDGNPLGLTIEDMKISMRTINRMASELKADIVVLQVINGKGDFKILRLLVRRGQQANITIDIRVMLLGDCGAGKSTLLGTLITGAKDDGKGKSRQALCSSIHEIKAGMTNKMSVHAVGFDSSGNVTNYILNDGLGECGNIIESSTKIISFIDVGGHSKYSMNLYSGLLSLHPDYAMILINCMNNITNHTITQFKLALATQKPLIVIVTHIDLILDEDDLEDKLVEIQGFLGHLASKVVLTVRNMEDAVLYSRTIHESVIPMLPVSCVNEKNVRIFKNFLNLLPAAPHWQDAANSNIEFYVHSTFNIEKNIILGGTVTQGAVRKHHVYYLGPCEKGKFYQIQILDIRCHKVSMSTARAGQCCTLQIKIPENMKEVQIRRGMVLVDGKTNPKASYEFIAELWSYDMQAFKMIPLTYEPLVISQTTRQICSIIVQKNDTIHKEKKLIDVCVQKQINSEIPIPEDISLITTANHISNASMKTNEEKIKIQAEEYSPVVLKKKDSTERRSELKEIMKAVESKERHYYFKSKQKNLLRLRFKRHPEFLKIGQTIVINDQLLKAVGIVRNILYEN